jgi:hypothetical protein
MYSNIAFMAPTCPAVNSKITFLSSLSRRSLLSGKQSKTPKYSSLSNRRPTGDISSAPSGGLVMHAKVNFTASRLGGVKE